MSSASGWLAPAKVNFGLRVVGRRPDGYHLLESVFLPLDLADRLEVVIERSSTTAVSLVVTGSGAGVPTGDDNLVMRAARAFLDSTGIQARVSVVLEKRIPVGAGLGGGSSDAGAILRALDAYFANAISKSALAAIGLELGADVPFFLDPRPAWVTGVGECIQPVAWPRVHDLLLVTPGPPLSTAEVFRTYDAELTPSGPSRRITHLRVDFGGSVPASRAVNGGPVLDLLREPADVARLGAEALVNDLEPSALRLRPSIARVRSELDRIGALAVAMSGSGPTIFGIFADATGAQAAQAEGRFEPTDRVTVARTRGAPG